MKNSSLFRIFFIVGLAGSMSLSVLNNSLSSKAQSLNFRPAQGTESWLINVNSVSVNPDEILDEPDSPRQERGIVCRDDQPLDECDDRIPMIDTEYPWSAIGRFVLEDADNAEIGHCTAVLIADDLVLTNAHCIVNPKTHETYNAYFMFEPNMIDGILDNPEDRAQVTGGVYGTDFRDNDASPNPNDWAIAQLDHPIGDKYGSIPLQVLPLKVFRNNPGTFTMVGYSFDFPDPKIFTTLRGGRGRTSSVQENCSVLGELDDGVLIHNCDTRGGASGGPILAWIDDKPYIVAVNSAELANPETGIGPENYATNISYVTEWILQNQ